MQTMKGIWQQRVQGRAKAASELTAVPVVNKRFSSTLGLLQDSSLRFPLLVAAHVTLELAQVIAT